MTKIQLSSPQQAVKVLQMIAKNKGIDSQGHVYITMKASFALITGIWKAIMLHKDLSFEEKKAALEAFQKITSRYSTYASNNIGFFAKHIFKDEEESLRVANKLIDTYPEFQNEKLISELNMLQTSKELLTLINSLENFKKLTPTSSEEDKKKYADAISMANRIITIAKDEQKRYIDGLVEALNSELMLSDIMNVIDHVKFYRDIGYLSQNEKNELNSYIGRLEVYTKSKSSDLDLLNAQKNTARSAIVDLKLFLHKKDPKLNIKLKRVGSASGAAGAAGSYEPPTMRGTIQPSSATKNLEKHVHSFISKDKISSITAGDFLKEVITRDIFNTLPPHLKADYVQIVKFSGTIDADTERTKYTRGELARISNFARDLETDLLARYNFNRYL